jgi:hypothetical protein
MIIKTIDFVMVWVRIALGIDLMKKNRRILNRTLEGPAGDQAHGERTYGEPILFKA